MSHWKTFSNSLILTNSFSSGGGWSLFALCFGTINSFDSESKGTSTEHPHIWVWKPEFPLIFFLKLINNHHIYNIYIYINSPHNVGPYAYIMSILIPMYRSFHKSRPWPIKSPVISRQSPSPEPRAVKVASNWLHPLKFWTKVILSPELPYFHHIFRVWKMALSCGPLRHCVSPTWPGFNGLEQPKARVIGEEDSALICWVRICWAFDRAGPSRSQQVPDRAWARRSNRCRSQMGRGGTLGEILVERVGTHHPRCWN